MFPQTVCHDPFPQTLSRSTSLSALEALLKEYLPLVANLLHSLGIIGKPDLRRRELIGEKLGELMKFRQGLNPSREKFSNTPDLYWAQPALEGLYFPLQCPRFVIRSQCRGLGYFNSASHVLETPQGEDKSDRRGDPYAAELQFVLRKVLTEVSTKLQ